MTIFDRIKINTLFVMSPERLSHLETLIHVQADNEVFGLRLSWHTIFTRSAAPICSGRDLQCYLSGCDSSGARGEPHLSGNGQRARNYDGRNAYQPHWNSAEREHSKI